MSPFNLYKVASIPGEQEVFESLLERKNVSIARICSPAGSKSAPLLQKQDEWVCLLQGEAQLEMAGQRLRLAAGETLFIPAGTPHRVLDTSDAPICIWLAVHIH
jgi:cupin 2 domain-containing protein